MRTLKKRHLGTVHLETFLEKIGRCVKRFEKSPTDPEAAAEMVNLSLDKIF
jgi:hypothetical protein